MAKPTLIYFAARGRAEVIRLILAEAGVEYEEQLVTMENFPALKKSGELPFEAVPVWREGDFVLAQSAAIANHLGRQHGLYPKDAKQAARCDEMLGAVEDVRNELRKLISAKPDERPAVREKLSKETLPTWCGWIEKRMGAKPFACGDEPSVADFALYYVLEMIHDNKLGEGLPAFRARIAKRPRIAAYLANPKRPPLNPLP